MSDEPGRMVSIDAVRGAAVIGIAFMNVAAFAMPFAAYDDPRAWGTRRWWDVAAWAFDYVAVDGKMRALFSALFGASLLLVAERAEASGRSGAAAHLRRMAWLAMIGVAHGLFLWFGDILLLYAGVGTVAFGLRRQPDEGKLVLALMLMAVPVLLAALVWGQGAAVSFTHAEMAADLRLHLSGWAAITRDRLATQPELVVNQLIGSGPETLGLMLAGMVGLRSGFLTGAWDRARYRRLAVRAYVLGLTPLAVMAVALVAAGFDGDLLLGANAVVGALCRPAVALGHAAWLLWWLNGGSGGWLKRRLAAAGRMALSNYLLTSLAGTTLFYGYGGALFGSIGRAAQLTLAATMGAVILAWSAPWLARFNYGPAEWAWRSLARWRWQPLRRAG